MGFWSQNEEGNSFAEAADTEMVWGDGPADIIDNALAGIIKEFEQSLGRRPTKAEIRAGLEFSLRIYTDDMKEED